MSLIKQTLNACDTFDISSYTDVVSHPNEWTIYKYDDLDDNDN